jgi:hypothetical protein
MHILCEYAGSITMKTEQSMQNTTKTEFIFAEVIDRLRRALKFESDAELSRVLGISTSNFSNRKAANSLPFEGIIQVCLNQGINLDWVFGKVPSKEGNSQNVVIHPIDPMLLGSIIAEFGYSQSQDFDPTKESFEQGYSQTRKHSDDVWIGLVAGTIYNNVMHLKGKKQRLAIFKEVSRLAESTRLYNMQKELKNRPIEE